MPPPCSDASAVGPGVPAAPHVPPSCQVVGDEDAVRQVLANLLGNVRAHTPPGTPVTVALSCAGGTAEVSVRDEGPGMEPDLAERAFDRFARGPAVRAGGGSGLGLSIVAEIVRAGGGSVSLTSAPGEGTTVRFTIPTAPTARTAAIARTATTATATAATIATAGTAATATAATAATAGTAATARTAPTAATAHTSGTAATARRERTADARRGRHVDP
nr:hypothetical protein GCM10020063_058930 [Dactylosporangium thailandense]